MAVAAWLYLLATYDHKPCNHILASFSGIARNGPSQASYNNYCDCKQFIVLHLYVYSGINSIALLIKVMPIMPWEVQGR